MKKAVFLLGLVSILAACAPSVVVTRLTPTIYPPTDHVDILQAKPTDREYFGIAGVGVELGKVKEVYQAIQMLAKAAQDLGADALLLLGVKEIGQTVTLINYGSWQSGKAYPDSLLMGAAIRYKREVLVVRHTNLDFLPTSRVDVLTTKTKPTGLQYIDLAQLSIPLNGLAWETALQMIYDAACKLGADAVIYDANTGILFGTAIRYK